MIVNFYKAKETSEGRIFNLSTIDYCGSMLYHSLHDSFLALEVQSFHIFCLSY